MASPNLLRFSFKPKRPANLYFMVMASVLCTLCYLVGVWQNSSRSNAGKTSSRYLITGVPCSTAKATPPNTTTTTTTNRRLDYSAHHLAHDPPPKAARVYHFPPCSPEFSEYTPCEDAKRSLRFDRERLVYRERHCPEPNEVLKCRIPAPNGYSLPFRWPESRDFVWFANVPHKELTVEKKMQNWIRFEKNRFRFPGGGTMFPNGAGAYIDDIGRLINLEDGSVRTAIDTGCGVASFGAYLLSRNILTVSFAPRDTHEAQVQFALERGVPALIGILASNRLPYPSRAFDLAHCSRCLIPWGQFDGLYLIEVDRILRPGGYWVLSGPPINWEKHFKGWQRSPQDLNAEQSVIESVARSLCWKKLKQKNDIAIWQKPTDHVHCIANRKVFKKPQFCEASEPDKAWYTKMEDCLTPLPKVKQIKEVAGGQLAKWPERLNSIPPRITSGSLKGITAEDFIEDTELWKKRVAHYKTIDNQLAEPGRYRNLLDMNSYLGGFAASMVDDPVWVMNIVPVEANVNTLGVIYERGLIGTYQNWCEAMSTYPRTYDFIHSDSVFSLYKDRCKMEDILLEMDRILRPKGSVIIRDDVYVLVEIRRMMDAMEYDTWIADHEGGPHETQKILLAIKRYWTSPPPTQRHGPTNNISQI